MLPKVLVCAAIVGCGAEVHEAGSPEVEATESILPRPALDDCDLNGAGYQCQLDVSYGAEPTQVYDIWLPNGASSATPLVIYIHGGGYFQGDKSSGYSRSFDAQAILEAGVAFATINYRLSGDFPFEKGVTGQFPPAMEDAARALQTLRAQAQAYNIDPAKVAVTGGSAGGGISLWLTFHDDLVRARARDSVRRQSSRPTCAAVMETQTTLDIEEVDGLLAEGYALDIGLAGLYGLTPEEYAQNSEELQVRFADSFQEASPISHLTADDTAKVMMTHMLAPGSGNIHSSEFGIYLANGRPSALANEYGRQNLAALGIEHTLQINRNARANQRAILDFILNDCFVP